MRKWVAMSVEIRVKLGYELKGAIAERRHN